MTLHAPSFLREPQDFAVRPTMLLLGAILASGASVASGASGASGGTPIADPIPAEIQPGTVHVRLEPIASGMASPIWAVDAPGHPDRLFVADQNGDLWSVDLETREKSIFLDASDLLVPLGIVGPGTYDERGLLGIAFHPEYESNGLFYIYISAPADEPADFSTMPPREKPDHQDVVLEWHVPNSADPSSLPDLLSARALFRADHPQFNHDGGALAFGPDGMLYIAIGDGGASDDDAVGHAPDGNGQELGTVLGKILRIDPLGKDSANGQYGIPADNPFAGEIEGLDEIWAYGFRNPFRMSFRRGGDQALYIGDVGQNDIEEIDIGQPGGNYGWRQKEGTFLFENNGEFAGFVYQDSPGLPADMIDPIAQYDHDEGIAVIGGFVYEGSRIPALSGRYVFGDWLDPGAGVGRLLHMPASGGQIVEMVLVGQENLAMAMLGMGRDADNELYVLANTTQTPFGTTGVVFRIEPLTGDLDADGDVDGADLGSLLASWGPCGPPTCAADFNGDGMVDGADLGALLANWT